ncbi:ribosomal protein S18 acetylase RimI-like enzyme [Prauserella shujinwangii]|uniref:Ribosomal protein S18 acetylase RimI-like enzyme n=1 Tax=Prauserella shujinwangii TaxID=1453103 RepID=A0A2T0M2S5_9PSEU|nr:GNAT family N-acetyltransferase [Prauserella shujinwangii]PRX51061.1 ribosomal protein S18 acetylase RimI-like enzyme [Prauserella shujinwangii]
MSTADVRPATPADVTEIARIQLETWRAAYADVLGSRTVAELDHADLERRWSGAVEHPETAVYVATEGRFTVGFCVAGPAPDEDVAAADGSLPADAGRTGLIATVLVEPRWGRRGHGGRLLAGAAAGLRERGAERGITWVPQSDPATLSFYRGAGWNPDGTVRTLDTGEKTVRELRLTGTLELRLTE